MQNTVASFITMYCPCLVTYNHC